MFALYVMLDVFEFLKCLVSRGLVWFLRFAVQSFPCMHNSPQARYLSV